jgi:putative membrane protein
MAKTKGKYFRSSYHMWLVILYVVWWAFMAYKPVYFSDWLIENILVAASVILFWWAYPKVRFSNLSFTLIAIFLALHTLGSHYTYAEVPLGDWISEALELERNHYDRVIHFIYGLFLFWPLREASVMFLGHEGKRNGFISLLFIAGSSAVYETMEWVTAEVVSPEAAMAFLGVQGDVFDAQKDHTLALIGGLISFFIAVWLAKRNKLPKPS